MPKEMSEHRKQYLCEYMREYRKKEKDKVNAMLMRHWKKKIERENKEVT